MKYGCCISSDILQSEEKYVPLFKTLAKAGFDYVELPFYIVSGMNEEELTKLKAASKIIPFLACNIFFPSSLKLVGQEKDVSGVEAYLKRMLPVAKDLGVETLVFGNGGARRIPDGQSYDTIWEDLRKIVETMEVHAKKVGITIAIEPLNSRESNIILSYGEAVKLAEGLTHITTMIDSYHNQADGRNYDDVYENPDYLGHLHTAYQTGRMVPSPKDDMSLYADFVKMVKTVGYNGKITVEASLRATEPEAIEAEYAACIDTLKKLFR